VGSGGGLDGSASLVLLPGVAYRDQEETVFAGMLEGWQAQRAGGRNLRAGSVRAGLRIVRRFHEFAGEYRWRCTAASFDEWMEDLASAGAG
jgi:hypothetical protein